MGEMIERVARAIIAGFDEVTEPDEREDCLRLARAAIEAMREPTAEMVQAAMLTAVRENKGIEYAPSQGWRAMIDAILSDAK